MKYLRLAEHVSGARGRWGRKEVVCSLLFRFQPFLGNAAGQACLVCANVVCRATSAIRQPEGRHASENRAIIVRGITFLSSTVKGTFS